MILKTNSLYDKMVQLIVSHDFKKKLIIGNEGGSRSGKTVSTIQLIVSLCDSYRGEKLDIYFFRDTLTNCKEYLLKDFINCLTEMQIYSEANLILNEGKPNYNLFGQIIKFRGLDDNSTEIKEPSDSDIIFVNEALSGVKKEPLDGWMMRCRRLAIMDWNPKYIQHFIFEMQHRDNCVFFKSNYKQNKFLQQSIIDWIEQYCPWDLSDWTEDGWKVPVDQRKPNLKNIEAKTVDLFRWTVYGEGSRAVREGLVFTSVTYVELFPNDCDRINYGLDFGTAHPTVIVKCGVKNMNAQKPDLYLQKLFYMPCENSNIVIDAVQKLGIHTIWCDTNMDNKKSGTGWVHDMRKAGIKALLTKKFPGSREHWITTLKKFNIHIVNDKDFKTEQENFCYRVVDGIQLSETIESYDDCWSAAGYGTVGFGLRSGVPGVIWE